MSYTSQGSWRNLWYYLWKRVDENTDISFNEIFSDPYTQKLVQEQYHNLGPDLTKKKMKDMYKDIKQSRCGKCEDCDEEDEEEDLDGGEELTESLYRTIKNKERAERNFERLVENLVAKRNR